MKALSVRQPWAYLICSGIKDVENRTWKTNYRGAILIHAPLKEELVITEKIIHGEYENYKPVFEKKEWWDFGKKSGIISAIIGSVEIIDCIQNSQSKWAESGCYHWVLKNPVLFDQPILNVKGSLSLWNYKVEKTNDTN